MATRTKPLITAAALASVAAIAVASPALAPNLTPTPAALSAAQVELTTFSDLLSVPASEWSNVYFTGWGGAITPINVDDQTYADYWLPNCDNNCYVPGISGVAYLALDALINGDGSGWNAANPGAGWGVSAVNYFFEGGSGGPSAGLQYLTEYPFLGEPYRTPGPLYNPTLSSLIALAWQGPYALTTIYVQALSTIAVLANSIPLIGPYLYRGIGSYIGPAFATVDALFDYSAYAGLSGVARYILGVITTGGNPNPYPTNPPPTVASVESVAAAATSLVAAKSAPVEARATRASVEAPKAGDIKPAETNPADIKPAETGPAESASTDSTPVSTGSADVTATEAVSDSKPDVTPAVDSPSNAVADTTADSTPAATKPAEAPAKAGRQQRPVRSALERATKKIGSAIGAAAKSAPAAGGSADAGASAS